VGQSVSQAAANPTAEAAAVAAAVSLNLPPAFDWKAYLDYNPDLPKVGITTVQLAAQHFHDNGKKEGRVHKRIPLVLRYTACGGLMNQHYSHLAALVMAVSLGADVILPGALKRDTFAHYFSQNPSKNEVG
jgi:hypothetical protein